MLLPWDPVCCSLLYIADFTEAAAKAMGAAERRRKLAAHVFPAVPNELEGMSKRGREQKTATLADTPSCKTPNPKHSKCKEAIASPDNASKKLFETPSKAGGLFAVAHYNPNLQPQNPKKYSSAPFNP